MIMKFNRFRDSGIYVPIVLNINKKFLSARRLPQKLVFYQNSNNSHWIKNEHAPSSRISSKSFSDQ